MDGNKMLTYLKKNTLQIVQTCQPILVHYNFTCPSIRQKNVLTFQSKHEDVFIQTNVRLTTNERSFFRIGQLPHIHPFFRSEVKRIGRSDVERIVPGLDVRQGTVYTPSAQ